MKKFLINAAVAIAVFGVLFFALNYALSIPDVYVSHSTGECVKVVNYTDEVFSCENLPSKFNHVWAK